MKRLNDKVVLFGDHDENTIKQIQKVADHWAVERAAVLADGHMGYAFPIGGVAAYHDHLSLSGVGFDIGCGNKAVRLNVKGTLVQKSIKKIMDDVVKHVSFGQGRANQTRVDHEVFDGDVWKLPSTRALKELARTQLGTVGGGNHFCNIAVDENDDVWVCVHFGSRGLGHKITKWFIEEADASDDMMAAPVVFHEKSALGEEYIEAMQLGLRYAYAGRDWVCDEVTRLIGAKIVESVHNNHNFAQKEIHENEELWVVRKGSTPAMPGQRGFIGSSMAEESVIVEGVKSKWNKETLSSTVHGAGRAISRSMATGKRNRKTGQLELNPNGTVKRAPMVTDEMMQSWVGQADVELRGGDVDEAPQCYKRLPEVLAEQGDTIKILHRLQP
ncbi:MAG TPA: RtcB family protein, partial [Fimbriimonas sp.]|nr:RtcB family protein [Fimbriimonas sp.]